MNWLLGRRSKLSLANKLLIYNVILKPVWTYALELWGSASTSNIEIIQRIKNKVLRCISNAPWFTRNEEIHGYLEIPTIKEEIQKRTKTYIIRL